MHASADLDVREIDFSEQQGGPQKVVVVVPRWGDAGDRLPLLIALLGRGESNHGLAVGAWGWVRDYWLDRAMLALRQGSVSAAALGNITNESHLNRLNAALAAHPFRGIAVACPYTPDILSTDSLDAAEQFADFVERWMLPRLRAELPIETTRAATGIDEPPR